MLACTRLGFLDVLGRSLPPVQQRLFTGGLFPADINSNLHRFAQQHQLRSNIWIPLKAFDTALKPFSVFVLPSAALCDVSISPGGLSVGQTAMGSTANRVLVNAEHTSNPQLFEHFHAHLVPSPATIRSRSEHDDTPPPPTADPERTRKTRSPPLSCPIRARVFDHPINERGEPLLDPVVVRELTALKRARGYVSNYWVRGDGTPMPDRVGRRNAEETHWPGRLNPTYANDYRPVSLTGEPFREDLALAMLSRVARYGYVSRLWVTLAEAQNLFGTCLRLERAHDAPWLIYGGDSVTPVALYCADQFEDSERLFPSPKEIELARKGVWLPPEKLRGFPRLLRLCQEAKETREATKEDGEAGGAKSALAPGTAVLQDARVGADTSMGEAKRHMRLVEEKRRLAHIRLFGFRTRSDERWHLRQSGLEETLREHAMLRDFPTPHFFSFRHVHAYGLQPQENEVGAVVHPFPCRLWDEASLDGEVWFNVAQLTDPWTALRLFYHHPAHFLTRRRLPRALATQCCQLQQQRGYTSAEWLPRFVVQDAGWSVTRGAPSVPFVSSQLDWDYLLATAQTRSETNSISARRLSTTLVNVDEVELPADAKAFLRHYRPVDDKGRPYLRLMRMLTTLRAHEQGYTSPVWVPLFPNSSYVCRMRSDEGMGDRKLKGDPFNTWPLVRCRGCLFANAGEVENWDPCSLVPPVPREDMCAAARAREERGEGTSAEKLCVPEMRRQRCDEEDEEEERPLGVPGRGLSAEEDVHDVSHDISVDDFD